jgi:hypothetical protein
MRTTIQLILITLGTILFMAFPGLGEDCDLIKEEKVCWDSGTNVTLSWSYPGSTVGNYQIEVRDFNWLGSAFVKVTHNNSIKEGMLSEGEAFIFDFTEGSDFSGIKIIADQVSNINPMPANIGTYPDNPNAKITVKLQEDEEKKIPELGVGISTEGEAKIGARVTVYVKTENSGEADLLDTNLTIYYDGLNYDANNGVFGEGTAADSQIQWENVSNYRLTTAHHTIVKDGFFIDILNFSAGTALISAGYNLITQSDRLMEGNSIIFNFTNDKYYRGVKLTGKKISSDSAELTLQFPRKNLLKRNYYAIYKGTYETTRLSFLLPSGNKSSFPITVNAAGKDREGKTYEESSSTTISASNLNIKKKVSNSILGGALYPESYPGVGGIRGIRNITYVTLIVENQQVYPVYGARLMDTIPPGFNFLDDANRTAISWVLDIGAGEYKEFRYEIQAKRQGVYNLPKADLKWVDWGEEVHNGSESPKTKVSGPYLGIDRRFSKSDLNIGENLQVTLFLINNGDVPTNVTVREVVPQNATFLSGQLSYSGFLNPGEQANIAYNISMYRAGELEFDEPEISSRNLGFDWHSQVPVRKVRFLSQGSEPAITPSITAVEEEEVKVNEMGLIQRIDENAPWLEGAVSISSFLIAIILLLSLNKINRIF